MIYGTRAETMVVGWILPFHLCWAVLLTVLLLQGGNCFCFGDLMHLSSKTENHWNNIRGAANKEYHTIGSILVSLSISFRFIFFIFCCCVLLSTFIFFPQSPVLIPVSALFYLYFSFSVAFHPLSIQTKSQSLIRPREAPSGLLFPYQICSNRQDLYRIKPGMWGCLSNGYATNPAMLSAPKHKPGQASSSSLAPSALLAASLASILPTFHQARLPKSLLSAFPCVSSFLSVFLPSYTSHLPVSSISNHAITKRLLMLLLSRQHLSKAHIHVWGQKHSMLKCLLALSL